ncbi:hypothetical protein CK203_052206 [Vitis vinifera]|uniref:CCR4-NOT transcription complex subunit 10 n=1 Tax=Vitis vinifera TaxID=29760 RepID=A0A438CWE4_VITVI|nr:hypothetical protein CK203_092007 [Vitis vinifera]RVW74100.1 hypothetical protein CK203_052206 [Vitis vinifera]
MWEKRSEELAHASGENAEAATNLGNKVGSKGTNTMALQFSAASSGSMVYTDEFDTSVATLNLAIVWFHLHEYGKALSVLESLYQNIEPIDETTALHICLLLLDVALASHDVSRCAETFHRQALRTLHGDPKLEVLIASQQPTSGKFRVSFVTGFESKTMCHLLGPHFLVFTLINWAIPTGRILFIFLMELHSFE